ncbi:hypothetical protein [Xanthomonas albilineans]|uniref:hypothetical protein n=1 Tax=Xanthomonas albilineans TaxID=29447 RepID=UPI003CCC945A
MTNMFRPPSPRRNNTSPARTARERPNSENKRNSAAVNIACPFAVETTAATFGIMLRIFVAVLAQFILPPHLCVAGFIGQHSIRLKRSKRCHRRSLSGERAGKHAKTAFLRPSLMP